jgi:hypothetical protein
MFRFIAMMASILLSSRLNAKAAAAREPLRPFNKVNRPFTDCFAT